MEEETFRTFLFLFFIKKKKISHNIVGAFIRSLTFIRNVQSHKIQNKSKDIIIIIIIIYPLIARVAWAPQMISQPVSSISPVLHCPLGLGKIQACPFPDVVFPPLPLSALSSSPFLCALEDGFGET